MDELEKFIHNQRSSFNDQQPPTFLWDKIAKELPSQKTKPARVIPLQWAVRVAAAFLLLAIAAGVLTQRQHSQELASLEQKLATVKPELLLTETHYKGLIGRQIKELKSLDNTVGKRFSQPIMSELSTLETDYQAMKQELINSQGNERVLGAMIENFMLRTQLLQRQIELLQSLDTEKNQPQKNTTNHGKKS